MTLKNKLVANNYNDHYDIKLVDFISLNKGNLPHLLFWGNPGTGKTKFAELLAKDILGEQIHLNFYEYNASDDRGIDVIRQQVKEDANAGGFTGIQKIILLDEADYLTHEAQASLRRIMDTSKARFILTANYPNKIIDALKNRCSTWEFKGPSKEWVKGKLKGLPSINQETLEKSLDSSPPSFRSIISNYDAIVSGGNIEETKKLLDLTPKEFVEMSWTADAASLIIQLHKEILNLQSPKKADLLICLADVDYKASLNTNKQLQLQVAFLKMVKILKLV